MCGFRHFPGAATGGFYRTAFQLRDDAADIAELVGDRAVCPYPRGRGAAAMITWDEFDITIPYVDGNSIVAGVEDEVRLRMEFLARAE